MQIVGNAHMNAPVPVAWTAFHDPGVLARTIPGVKELRENGQDRYDLTVVAGVASIKGSYEGTVALSEQEEHESFLLTANGSGAPGTIGAKVRVRMSEAQDGGTDLAYEADAIVGGAIGGVGQRMLGGVAKRMASQFFAAIDRDIARGGEAQAEAPAQPAPVATGDATAAAAAAAPQEADGEARPEASAPAHVGAPPPPAAPATRDDRTPVAALLLGLGAGAGIALAGVALGAAISRGGR